MKFERHLLLTLRGELSNPTPVIHVLTPGARNFEDLPPIETDHRCLDIGSQAKIEVV